SETPSSSSADAMVRDTTGWLVLRSRAACSKPRASATASIVRACLRLMRTASCVNDITGMMPDIETLYKRGVNRSASGPATDYHGEPLAMTDKTLEDRIRHYGNPAHMLQNSQVGPYQFPIAPQYTNWMEEVRAWRH